MTLHFELDVSEDSPFFRGHFVDEPVLPAIAQLAFLEEWLVVAAGGLTIEGVHRLRFKAPVRPGDKLHFSISPVDEEGRLEFVIRRGEEPVTQGVVSVV